MNELVDTFGRRHETLRISVTDRCQMRCTYCLPNGAPAPLPREEILSFEEIARIVRIAADRGVRRIRYTGGEPLLRRDLHRLVALTAAVPGIETIALTTNGLLLGDKLDALVAAGLSQVSISLDTVDPDQFRRLTGTDDLPRVIAAVRLARSQSIGVEMNAVAMRGETESALSGLLRFSKEVDAPIRFIELMPFEDVEWSAARSLSGTEIRRLIDEEFGADSYEEIARSREAAPSRRFRFRDGRGGFGLIEPVSNPFCGACDRLRIRSDGMLYSCLFSRTGYDLRTAVRTSSDDEIAMLLMSAVRSKGPGGMLELHEHAANPPRVMAEIGG